MGYERIEWLTSSDYFRGLYVAQNIWKESGWNAIIFLAALAAVDPTLYEAAVVDGANRWRQVWHITLPALKSTIVILFILRLGQIMDLGFEHILLLQNPVNLDVADVFDTYVYRNGVLQGNFSYSTAVGIFKSVIGLLLIVLANRLAKAFGHEGCTRMKSFPIRDKDLMFTFLSRGILVISLLTVIFPFLYVVLTSFAPREEIVTRGFF